MLLLKGGPTGGRGRRENKAQLEKKGNTQSGASLMMVIPPPPLYTGMTQVAGHSTYERHVEIMYCRLFCTVICYIATQLA